MERRPHDGERNQTDRYLRNGTGTIRDNLERNRSDSVSDIKARQSERRRTARMRREEEELLKRTKRKKLIIRLAVVVFVILICVAGFLFTYRVFYDEPLDEEDTKKVEITIPEGGISDEEVAKMLSDAGVIKDTGLYKLRTFIYDAAYVPGTYEVSPSYTTEKIINILSGYDYSNGLMVE